MRSGTKFRLPQGLFMCYSVAAWRFAARQQDGKRQSKKQTIQKTSMETAA
jgi:hypothetical protein